VFATFALYCRSLARAVCYFCASCPSKNLAKVCNACLWTRSRRTNGDIGDEMVGLKTIVASLVTHVCCVFRFFKIVLLAAVGSMILQTDFEHFALNKSLF